jgi:hypothetical protein
MKPNIPPVLIIFALVCFALFQQVQSATDTPDPAGPLPVSNTADGQNALLSITTGIHNSAFGFDALLSNTDANFNTAVGSVALLSNTGTENTAVGAGALISNTTGDSNTAVGTFALFFNTTGNNNTAVGEGALFNNTSDTNTATGASALFSNTTGSGNTADGVGALDGNTTGGLNTAIGDFALQSNTTGTGNIALGYFAGQNSTTGSYNIHIGNEAFATDDHTIRIGSQGVEMATFIAGIYGATVSGGTAVYVDSDGQLGTSTSSARFKQDIQDMGSASDVLVALRPVTFRYKPELDPRGIAQFGLVAEEVEKVNPDLVVRDKEGKPYTVRYEAVNAMLLNEFLKEHRKNEEQEKTIAELKSGMTALAATVKEQAAQIQKVSAQLEASKPAPQVVNNP